VEGFKVDSSSSAYERVAVFFGHGEQFSGFVNGREFLELLRHNKLFKKDSTL
jgi:hypothetical protein